MTTVIQAEHLKFSYGDKAVLKDINLTVQPGEIVGLVVLTAQERPHYLISCSDYYQEQVPSGF